MIPPHFLTNFETQTYYQNDVQLSSKNENAVKQVKLRFTSIYSRNSLPKIKNRTYFMNFKEYTNIETHLFARHVKNETATFFDSFSDAHIPKDIKKFVINKIIKTNIYRIQVYDSMMCLRFCIGFIDFV